MTSMLENEALEKEGELLDIDPIWTTSRTARQIYALGEVEKVFHASRESRSCFPFKLPTGYHSSTLFGGLVHIATYTPSNGCSR